MFRLRVRPQVCLRFTFSEVKVLSLSDGAAEVGDEDGGTTRGESDTGTQGVTSYLEWSSLGVGSCRTTTVESPPGVRQDSSTLDQGFWRPRKETKNLWVLGVVVSAVIRG